MLASELNNLFNKNVALEDFKKEIQIEISNYKKSLSKKGASSPIFLNEDVQGILLKEEDVKFLCDAFLQGKLDKWELNYIAEALLLSEKVGFDNNKVEDALLALADSEYFKIINTEFIRSILDELDV